MAFEKGINPSKSKEFLFMKNVSNMAKKRNVFVLLVVTDKLRYANTT
jgi:hypothetical protein